MKPNCDRCKNNPAYYNVMREICNPCIFEREISNLSNLCSIFEREEPKPKKTRADKIRSLSNEQLAQFLVDVSGVKDETIRTALIAYEEAWLQEEDDE